MAVVRDIEALNYSGDTAVLFIATSVPGPLAGVIWYVELPSTAASVQWKGRAVVPAGGLLQGTCSQVDNVVSISGYLLSA